MTRAEAARILGQYDVSPMPEMYWTDGERIPASEVISAYDMAIEALLEKEAEQ